MRQALAAFEAGIQDARSLTALYDFLTASVRAPFPYDDLLRSQVVYSISAFDKLVHDLIRIGMVAIFTGTRIPTAKYKSELISIEFHGTLVTATVPPKELLFEQQIGTKLRMLSYQDPAKIADGLSYIWPETDKWGRIGGVMGLSTDDAKTKLKLIVSRRNAIVHESDVDAFSKTKNPISRAECADMTDFTALCGRSIAQLVM